MISRLVSDYMLIERDRAVVEFGSTVSAGAGPAPEIRVAADEGCRGRSQSEEPAPGQEGEAVRGGGSRAFRVGRAFVAYAAAGVIGWSLYDLAPPNRIYWPDVAGIFAPRNSAQGGELLRQMKDIRSELQALQSRIDAVEAVANTRGGEAKNILSIEDANRHIDEVRARVDAQIGALSFELREIKRDMEARAPEPRPAVAEQAAKHGGDIVEDGHPPAPAVKHAESESKHSTRRRHDAFDPATDPTAPGAPRPLGGGLSRGR